MVKFFFRELIYSLKVVFFDNIDICFDIYDYFYFRIFETEWTFFRILRTLLGWSLGFLPLFYVFLGFLLLLFFFLRVLYVSIETIFLSFLFIYYKEDQRIMKRLLFLFKVVTWFFSIVYFLDDLFSYILPSFRESLDYFFSIECLQDSILILTTKVADFIVDCIVLFDNDIEFIYNKINNSIVKQQNKYKRKKPYYDYIFKALYKKSKYMRNWVILFYDIRKVIVIFKAYFFKMSYLDFVCKIKLKWIFFKARFLVFQCEHFFFFEFLKNIFKFLKIFFLILIIVIMAIFFFFLLVILLFFLYNIFY